MALSADLRTLIWSHLPLRVIECYPQQFDAMQRCFHLPNYPVYHRLSYYMGDIGKNCQNYSSAFACLLAAIRHADFDLVKYYLRCKIETPRIAVAYALELLPENPTDLPLSPLQHIMALLLAHCYPQLHVQAAKICETRFSQKLFSLFGVNMHINLNAPGFRFSGAHSANEIYPVLRYCILDKQYRAEEYFLQCLPCIITPRFLRELEKAMVLLYNFPRNDAYHEIMLYCNILQGKMVKETLNDTACKLALSVLSPMANTITVPGFYEIKYSTVLYSFPPYNWNGYHVKREHYLTLGIMNNCVERMFELSTLMSLQYRCTYEGDIKRKTEAAYREFVKI